MAEDPRFARCLAGKEASMKSSPRSRIPGAVTPEPYRQRYRESKPTKPDGMPGGSNSGGSVRPNRILKSPLAAREHRPVCDPTGGPGAYRVTCRAQSAGSLTVPGWERGARRIVCAPAMLRTRRLASTLQRRGAGSFRRLDGRFVPRWGASRIARRETVLRKDISWVP